MDNNYRLGIFYGLGAYLLWGVLPIYWKLLQHVEAMDILASRFLWSAVFVFLLLLATGKLNIFMQETKTIFSTKKTACCMVLAAITISFNWGIFIWAVEAGRIVETSMGYYIGPLMNVLFGVVFLHERLSKLQFAAVGCAAAGIAVIVVHNGGLPLVAITLSLTSATCPRVLSVATASMLRSARKEYVLPLRFVFWSKCSKMYLTISFTRRGSASAFSVSMALTCLSPMPALRLTVST